MTNSELRDILSNYPDDMDVCIELQEDGMCEEITSIEIQEPLFDGFDSLSEEFIKISINKKG